MRCAREVHQIADGRRRVFQCPSKAANGSNLCAECRAERMALILARPQPPVKPWSGMGGTWRRQK